MSESRPSRPAPGPQTNAPAKPGPATPNPGPSSAKATPAQPAGEASRKVVHDERGNAVWNWLKEASRIAIESTSALLKKLEAPELKMEDTNDTELRIMPDAKELPGGGYDPYSNTAPKPRKPAGK
jgi:hypothetical protein